MLDNNLQHGTILSQNIGLQLDRSNSNINNNVLVISSPGTGLHRSFVYPNIMQMNTNYVIIDNEMRDRTEGILKSNGYRVSTVNLPKGTDGVFYDPFSFVSKDGTSSIELDIYDMTAAMLCQEKQSNMDEFFYDAEFTVLNTVLMQVYLSSWKPTFAKALETLTSIRESESPVAAFQELVDKMKAEHPDYVTIHSVTCTNQIFESVFVSLSKILIPFLSYETVAKDCEPLNVDNFNQEKNVLFINLGITDSLHHAVASLLVHQLMKKLTKDGTGKYVTRVILDDFTTLPPISDIDTILTASKDVLAVNILIQNLVLLKHTYPRNWNQIIASCDTILFFGGRNPETIEYVSKMAGTKTIVTESVEQEKKDSVFSFKKLFPKRKSQQLESVCVLSPNDISNLRIDDCIIFMRGQKPIMDKKVTIKIMDQA